MHIFATLLPQVRTTGLAAMARQRLAGIGQPLRRATQESARARARAALMNLADACERSQPNLARELRCAAAHNPPA